MNEYTFVIRTDKVLHDRIRKLAYLANTSRSAAIRKLLQSQEEEQQIATLIG
jgi:predicted transcriptional regulator